MSGDERTELEAVRAELSLLRTRFNQLVEQSSEAMYLKDLNSRYVYVNASAAEMMFRRPEELVGSTDEGVFSPDAVEEIRADDRHVMRTSQTAIVRTARVMGNGRRLEFLTVKRPWFDEAGRVQGVIGTTQDVSELATLQREAAEASEGFLTLLNAASEAIFVHRGGVVSFANPTALRVLGRPEGEVVGMALTDFARLQDREGIARMVRGEAAGADVGLVRADGSVALLEFSDVVAAWCGDPARVAIGRDVSERRQLEGRLRDADRLASAGVLAGSLVHEIRSPLTFVLAAVGQLQEAAIDPGQRARLAEVIDAAGRIEGIVSAMSGIARPDVAVPGPVDAEEAIDRALLLGGARMRGAGGVRRVRGGVPPVVCSERGLVQVLLNLVVNAAQSMEAGADEGVLTVSTSAERGQVVIRVEDTGAGVPASVAGRLFQPFATTKASDEGTGLGLWVSRGIIEEMGGTLTLENPGQRGAAFAVRLAAAPASLPATVPERAIAAADRAGVTDIPTGPRPAPERTGLPRLLLVDDEELIRNVVEEGLAGSFAVVACSGVMEAVARLEAGERFDLLLCDLVMPDGGGARLHAELSRFDHPPPMVFMSGGAPTSAAREFLARARIEPIAKPFRLAGLRRALLEAIGSGT
jgi:PAS domain S-box-containing protein